MPRSNWIRQVRAGCSVAPINRPIPCVVDLPFLQTPADDVLLSDLTWENLANVFPGKVHSKVEPGSQPTCIVAPTHRVLALLPVGRKTAGTIHGPFHVPFLVDTGAPTTFFTKQTVDELKLDLADHIDVLGIRVLTLNRSSHHFDDINLLGTDVLQNTRLLIDYPAKRVSIDVATVSPQRSVWVRPRDGGPAFKVTPRDDDVDSLKKAIKAEKAPELDHIAADRLTLYTVGADGTIGDTACDPETALISSTKYAFAPPS